MPPMQIKHLIPTLVALLLLQVGCGPSNEFVPPPPPTVTVSEPMVRDVTSYMTFTGQTAPLETVDVRSRVSGFLKSVEYTDGDRVEAGDLLYVIDQEPFIAALNAATASLRSSTAERDLQKALLERLTDAIQRGAGSQVELLETQARYDGTLAAVDKANAELDKARLDLGYTEIQAAMGGRLSRNLVSQGNLVNANETLLTTLIELEPIRVYFEVNERDLVRMIKRERDEGHERRREDIVVELELTDGSRFEETGLLDFVDNTVDARTGTMKIRATFPNERHVLVPGLFVRVMIPMTTAESVLVPEIALQRDVVGSYALVVDEKGIVQRRDVELGAKDGKDRVIASGLDSSERVIVNGLQRAQPGNPVQAVQAGS